MIKAILIIVPIFIIIVFVLVIAQLISPKFSGKLMIIHVKEAKYIMDESKEDIKSISTDMDNATKAGIETTARAIKKGLTEDSGIYCKHCGSIIDEDSTFCKNCGEKQ